MNWRRTTRTALLSAALIAAIAAVALLLLHTAPVRSRVLKTAADYLQSRYGLQLESSQLDYNLFNGAIVLGPWVLRSASPAPAQYEIRGDALRLRIGLWEILHRSVRISEAEILGLSVSIVRNTAIAGTAQAPAAQVAQKGAASNAPDILISSLRIRDASLNYRDPLLQLQLSLPKWQLQISGEERSLSHIVKLSATSGADIQLRGRSIPIQEARLEALWKNDAVEVLAFDLQSQAGRLQLSGQVKELADPKLDLRLAAALSLEQILKLAGASADLQGDIDLNAGITGSLSNLSISTRTRSERLRILGMPDVRLNADADWEASSGLVRVRSISAESARGTLRGAAQIDLTNRPGMTSSLEAELSRLDLLAISRDLKLPVLIASRANGNLRARWPGIQWDLAAGQANASLEATQKQSAKGILPVESSLTVGFEGQNSNWTLLSARTLGAGMEGNLQVRSLSDIEGRLTARAGSLKDFLAQLRGFTGGQADPAESAWDLDGAVSATATLGGSLQRPKASAVLNGSGMRVGAIQNIGFQSNVAFESNQLHIDQTRIQWQGQRLDLSGDLDFHATTPVADIAAAIESAEIKPLAAALFPELPISGTLRAQMKIDGPVNRIHGRLKSQVSGLSLVGESLGDLEADAELADGQINLHRFRLRQPGSIGSMGTLEATGEYALGSGKYMLHAAGEGLRLQNLQLPGDWPLKGVFRTVVDASGTLSQPAGNLRLEAQDVEFGDRQLGSLSFHANMEPGSLIAEAAIPGLNLTGTAQIRLESPYTSEIKLRAQNTDLSRWPMPRGSSWIPQGTLSTEIVARADLADWKSGRVSAQISDLKLHAGQAEIRNEGPLELRLDPKELVVPAAKFTMQDARLQIEGRFPLAAAADPGALTLSGESELSSLQRLFSISNQAQVSGKLGIQLRISGNLQKLNAAGRLSLRNGGIAGSALAKPIEGLEADAVLSEGNLKLERLLGRWAGAAIEARGDLPLGLIPWDAPSALPLGSGPALFSLEVKDLPLNALADLPPDFSGLIGLRVQGQAPRLDLSAIRAQAEVTPLRLKFGDVVVEQTTPAAAWLENGLLRLGPVSLKGPGTALQLSGSAGLIGARPIDVTAEGNLDAALMAFWIPGLKASGDTHFNLAVNGSLDAPEMSGFIEARQGRLAMPTLGLLADGVDLRIALKGDRLDIERLTGTLNGGSLQAGGGARLQGGQLQDVRLDLSANNLFLNIPAGLKTRSSAAFQIRSQQENIVIGGQARILEGSYRDRLDLESNILSQLNNSAAWDEYEPPSAFLSRVRYDLGLSTEGPVVIDNNLAKLSLDADLRIGGGYYKPIITGRITMAEGGQAVFNERRYIVEKGIVDFLNQSEIEPSFDISAKTQVAGEEISVLVSGTPKTLTTKLSSDQGLSEPDIMSLLLTGRTLDQLRGSELNVAKEQLLSQLTGRIGSSLTQNTGTALGLSELRIEPNLIAPESDPGARLTVGKDITGNLKLVYSMNLVNGGDQIWLAEFDYRRMFSSRAIKQGDNTYRYEFRHDLAIGGKAKPPRSPGLVTADRKRVGRIDFLGEGPLSKEKLASSFKIHSGDRFDFFILQDGLQRLGNLYAQQNRLEARVQAERQPSGDVLDLSVKIVPGPQIDFAFEGWDPPGGMRDRIRELWREGIVDSQRTEAAILEIRRSLVDQGYLEAGIDSRSETIADDQRRILFDIQPGTRYSIAPMVFDGASLGSVEQLHAQIRSARLSTAVFTEPDQVVNHLLRYFRAQGFLDAKVSAPRLELDRPNGTATPHIAISEGPRVRIGKLHFLGNHALSDFQLQPATGLTLNDNLESSLMDAAIERIEKLYWMQGYNDVEVRAIVERNSGSQEAGILFDIQENKQAVVAEIRLEGAGPAARVFARNHLQLTEGEVLSYDKLIRSRKHLYESGAYALVDISTENAAAGGTSLRPNQKPVAVKVQLREPRPLLLHYGGFYDTDRGPGGIADAAFSNFLGGPRVLGLQTRYDSHLRELRGFYSQPTLARWPLKTGATTFLRREVNETFITDRLGFSIQQEVRWRQGLLLSYGYRYERAHTFDKVPDPVFPFDITLPIARLTGAVSRDTRDDLLDASRGSFLSQALDFGSRRLGSDLSFIKYYGQYFKYLPLSKPAELAGSFGPKRPRWIFATGLRVGLAKGLGGQVLIPSERFFTGGGTTLRGFEQDQAGPKDYFGNPEGGNALFLLNNEIRFPGFKILDGAGFLDIGNVYRQISDFNPWSVRKAAGLGLRIRTPYFLLRVDYGFKLDRRPGESLGRFFFSIGQAY